MSPDIILRECEMRGVSLRHDRDRIRLFGPTDSLTSSLIACVRDNRATLIVMLDLVHRGSEDRSAQAGVGPRPVQGGPERWTKDDSQSPLNQTTTGFPESGNSVFGPSGPHGPQKNLRDTYATRNFSATADKGEFRATERRNEEIPYRNAPTREFRGPSGPSGPNHAPSWLSDRWGPGLDDDTPPIIIPRDWRDEVAAWPHDVWTRWRRMVDRLVSQEPNPTAETIRAADRVAYDVIRMEDETFIVTAK